MLISDNWKDFEVIDVSNGEKLERWNKYTLIRPDPQVIWTGGSSLRGYKEIDAHYHRSASGGGSWEFIHKLPEKWKVTYKDLKFNVKPTGFKHTGLFPEQAVNWDFIYDKIKNSNRSINVLNLFAYTGGATVAAASAGASVCHVDASKGMVQWAKENCVLSGLKDAPVRYIVDDVVKFVNREIRRGRKYDAIVMDPPSYGRGPNGEVWKIEDELYNLVMLCIQVLSDKPLFFIINSYTTGLGHSVIDNILKLTMVNKFGGKSYADEIGLPITQSGLVLPCGITGRWEEN